MDELKRLIDDLLNVERILRDAADTVAADAGVASRLRDVPGVPWDRDIRDDLYRHPNPTEPAAWWQRKLAQIDGVTIHHTLSDSPHAFAEYYCRAKGRPSTPYTIWISQTGEVLLCNSLEVGCWHDHTGHQNTHLSIGMAGRLHEYMPAEVQVRAAARVAAWAVRHTGMNVTRDSVVGHDEYARTQCPGWLDQGRDRWHRWFYQLLNEELAND